MVRCVLFVPPRADAVTSNAAHMVIVEFTPPPRIEREFDRISESVSSPGGCRSFEMFCHKYSGSCGSLWCVLSHFGESTGGIATHCARRNGILSKTTP